MNQCALCHDTSNEGLNRVSGLDVCDPCQMGDTLERVQQRRGWATLLNEYTITRGSGSNRRRIFVTEVSIEVPGAGAIDLVCRRKTFGWKLAGIVAPSLKGGDPLFDDNVYARSKTPDDTRGFVEVDGVQSAILDLLGESGRIEVRAGRVFAKHAAEVKINARDLETEVAVLAAYAAVAANPELSGWGAG